MLNLNNFNMFEGRLVKDPQITTEGSGQNAYTKAIFTLAVDRELTKEQKAKKESGGNIVTADYPQFVATGTTADIIAKYCKKGKPIKVQASYQSYKKQDNSGQTIYGHIFKVEKMGFTTQDSTRQHGSNNSGNSNYNNNYNNSYNNDNNYNNANNQFSEVDPEDTPF